MKKATAFKQMSTAALACRSLGHAWEIKMVTRRRSDGGVWDVVLECSRCDTLRNDIVPANSTLKDPYTLGRSYNYSNNYLVDDVKSWGGAGLLKRNARDVLYRRYKSNGTKK